MSPDVCTTDSLAALKQKEEMTKVRREAALLNTSLRHFIEQWIENNKTKDSAAELKLASELKAQRDSMQPA